MSSWDICSELCAKNLSAPAFARLPGTRFYSQLLPFRHAPEFCLIDLCLVCLIDELTVFLMGHEAL